MIDRLGRHAHSPILHAAVAAAFAAVMVLGYITVGGRAFVEGWGGGLAAVIATAFLVWKSQGYWAWMIVNAALWCALFFSTDLPLLAWLQVSLLLFAAYGMAQWALVKWRIGWNPRVRSDLVGTVLALGVFVYSVYAYRNIEGYTGTVWWALEAGSVLFAIAAMWLDAFRYSANWIAWTLSNVCAWPLFYTGRLWAPFATTFVYQAINVVGWVQWGRDEQRLRTRAAAAAAA
jgi:Nicotinamide mononucleotide transporter